MNPGCLNDTDNPKFCSKSCAATVNNYKYPKRFLEGHCKECGKPISARLVYCIECFPLFQYRDYSKITIDDLKNKRKYQKHSRIRDIARRSYIRSGRHKKCEKCGYDKYFEVCHIKSIYLFSDDTPISIVNALDNLIGLCPNCHWELDNGFLTL